MFKKPFLIVLFILCLSSLSSQSMAQEAASPLIGDSSQQLLMNSSAPVIAQEIATPETVPSDAQQVSGITQSTLYDNFQKGGPIMYLILLCSVGGFYITIEKIFVLRRSKILPRKFINHILDFIFVDGDNQNTHPVKNSTSAPPTRPEENTHISNRFVNITIPDHVEESLNQIIDYCEGKDIPVAKVLRAGLLEFDEGIMGMKSAITGANMHEGAVMEKGLSLLGMLGNIAPLLGLLGTVTGMISAFEMISIGGSGRPEIVASGISMALITTAGGLFVGIPLVLSFHFIQNKVDVLMVDLQEFSVDVLEKLYRECRR